MSDIESTGPVAQEAGPPVFSRWAVVAAVVRRGGPRLVEATFVPGVLFYVCLIWGGLGLAYFSAIAWIYGNLGRHLVRRERVPTVLILSGIGITLRTAVAIGSGSSFIYFMQPILGTVVTGGVFAVSLFVGRPLIGRLAGDFWPITPDMAENPEILSLFRGLTVLWAGVNLTTATVTFVLLLSLPLAPFIAVKQLSGLAITLTAITVTVVWSHRIACREGFVRAPGQTVSSPPLAVR